MINSPSTPTSSTSTRNEAATPSGQPPSTVDGLEDHPIPVDPAAASGPVDRVAECEALRAEVERLRDTVTIYKAEARGALVLRDEARAQLAAAEARFEAVQAERDHANKCLRDYMRLGPVEVFEQLLADRRAALAVSPPEPEADERPTPLSAEIREIAEMWLYDGDTDQPINDGYFRALDLANRLESPKGAS